MSTVVSVYRDKQTSKFVAHSLDFDLVCVGENQQQASHSLNLAVKTYVEFGLSKGWNNEIHFPAPQEFWNMLTPDTPLKLGPTIYIDNRSMLVFQAEPSEAVAA
jgi:hypothetical protein